ncbi:hypothetical protein [Catenulispora subtropica]|uniref:Uncharacterized protein n=1 Tax=Catenulispora subtropica TaxID=450798 RepID=A0ABN2QET9_9ACTN
MIDEELNDLTGGSAEDGMFADLGHFTTGAIPVDAVVKRGAAIRNRRRLVGGGVLAAAAALTIGVPVAIAGGSGPGAEAASGHTVVVDRPAEDAAQKITFSGSVDGRKWSRTLTSHCGTGPEATGAECMIREIGADSSPIGVMTRDERHHQEGDFYFAEFGPDVDYVVMTLATGDRVTVPALVADDGYRGAYFELPRNSTVGQLVAYDKESREIAHTAAGTVALSPGVHLTNTPKWYRPDGSMLDTSVPTVDVAAGTSGKQAWTITVTLNPYGRCFAERIGITEVDLCNSPRLQVNKNNPGGGGPQDAFVSGEVDLKTTRVDVALSDGTVQHLTPVRSHGYAFVGTYVPEGLTVASITPVTGTNS